MKTIDILVWVWVIWVYSDGRFRIIQGPGRWTPKWFAEWYRDRLPWHNARTGDYKSTVKDARARGELPPRGK